MRWVPVRAAAVFAMLAVPAALLAQYPPQAPALPPPLFVRLAGPAGMKVTIHRGDFQGQTLDVPCLIAFRPGYRYHIELSGLPENLRPKGQATPLGIPGPPLTVCPSLDVLGSLQPAACIHPWDHPATIFFTEDDFATVRSGAVVTKVVLLERPETAVPLATTLDRPYELTVPPHRDPLLEAQERGRPLVILHMGDSQASPQELAAQGVPGTVLLPGERMLPPPRDPPCLPAMCFPLVDPRSGLPAPENEICFHDGGDVGLTAGLRDGKLVGLDPSDTVAQYVDSCGNAKIAVSNKVCLCVPRYLLIRTAIATAANVIGTAPGNTNAAAAPAKSQLETVALEYDQQTYLQALTSRQKLSAVMNLQQTQVVGRSEGLVIYANAEGTGHVTGKCAEPEQAECPKPLVIFKWPDKCDPQIGDLVTFYIRYKNQGSRPITGIAVSDSLTARLEYVPTSARSDRDALFTTTPNEADSAVLRWEITGSLQAGETGTVCFQARVR
jgi:uncharacterized repeat protein (TIGR01451 family)